VRLYRQDGIVDSLLIDGIDGTVAIAPVVKIRVTKNAANLWSLFLDQPGTGNSYQLEGTSTESKYNTSSYFGVFCNYTSTRSDKFFFDDFKEVPYYQCVKFKLNLYSLKYAERALVAGLFVLGLAFSSLQPSFPYGDYFPTYQGADQ